MATITGPDSPAAQPRKRFRAWLLEGLVERPSQQMGPHARPSPEHVRHPWWKVMCLTGLDYFSTLGYQPGIAALAAGLLSPVATVVLVLVTLAGALPVYRRVAAESPHGAGSVAMLERLLTFWQGKLFVLVLLGFAATDFLITVTLSTADATEHLVENPHVPSALQGHEVVITLVLIALLGAVFLKGFTEAMGVAVVLVVAYLALNAVVVAVAIWHVVSAPAVVGEWTAALTTQHSNPLLVVGLALLVFPKLALGLSGFETGVAVMPHIQGDPTDTEERPRGRIRGATKLMTTAAIIMSVFLVTSSVVTTLLIPHAEFEPGGQAYGRALAYLAHAYLGDGFGTLYDLSTIAILWFAGASAMAGLLNLFPRYLPRYGMAPHWARAVRPMVLVFTAVAFLVTWLFDADVNAQGGAYATGVLVLITSAAVAVTIAARRARQRGWTIAFGVISAIFVYTTLANVIERPDGVKIGACFIAAILLISILSRLLRAFELRVTAVSLDEVAAGFLDNGTGGTLRLIANEPNSRDVAEYEEKLEEIRQDHDIPASADVLFVEITLRDPSEFETELDVRGELMHGCYRVLALESAAVPNALAALLLHLRDRTGRRPHIYFEWTEGNPITHFARFLMFGQGEVAPITREVLREAEPDRSHRPHVHVG
ncbi:amino acid transporter [Pseudonocardia alaniniphila]|uniref:Amino acid transporter n=1 Tax=Pseudonocardia alaniniphila TaxID=75291 RepID=A0ABS9T8K9_9PSEU|nr:amino acid transporter [Pseudonocardia alaniniphila]MCH6164869.1 amino acid transporter [Pseudonocardia alaniniphila]